jgi:hypothetical protein
MSETAAEASASAPVFAEPTTPASTNRDDSNESANDNTSVEDNAKDIRDNDGGSKNKIDGGGENKISPKSQQRSVQQQEARKRRKRIITTQRNEKDSSGMDLIGADVENSAHSESESSTGRHESNRPLTASISSTAAPSKKQKTTTGSASSVMTKETVSALMVPGVATKTTTITSKGKKKTQIRYDPSVPMDKEQLAVWRREARRVRNRESAAASRQRIRSRITELEDEVSGWKDKYETALARLHELEQQQQQTGSEASKQQQQLPKQHNGDESKPKSNDT